MTTGGSGCPENASSAMWGRSPAAEPQERFLEPVEELFGGAQAERRDEPGVVSLQHPVIAARELDQRLRGRKAGFLARVRVDARDVGIDIEHRDRRLG